MITPIVPCSVLPAVTLIQPPPQHVVVGRPAPADTPLLERLGTGHRTRLVLEDVEVVIEVQNLLPAAVTALMTGDTSTVVPDLEMGRVEAGLDFAAGPQRYRVGVGVHGDAAARIDQGERYLGQVEARLGDRQEMIPLDRESLADTPLATVEQPSLVATAAGKQHAVERVQV